MKRLGKNIFYGDLKCGAHKTLQMLTFR
jgi:hypothetical protein